MLHNGASCWLYLREYTNDARSHERQIVMSGVNNGFVTKPEHVATIYLLIKYAVKIFKYPPTRLFG
jgi:hypothetical protein